MNGLLPSVTWGTWDIENAKSEVDKNEVNMDKRVIRRRQKGIPQVKTQETAWFQQLLEKIDKLDALEYYENPLVRQSNSIIPWDHLPVGIHPKDGHLPEQRIQNKRHQVENLAAFLQKMLKDGDKVVEFCAGSGYVALPLACLFPKCHFVLLDMKKPSLDIAYERILSSGLKNVTVFCGKVDEYMETFDVGIALHACGEATDMVLEKCLESNAAYVLAPCCVGKIKHSELTYPRSNSFHNVLSRSEYQVFAKAADFGHTALTWNSLNVSRRRCKSYVETDRSCRAREKKGYMTAIYIMHPAEATPKNDILVGWPSAQSHINPPTQLLSEAQVLQALSIPL